MPPDGRFAAASGVVMKIPAPMTMPTQTDTACHELSVLAGTPSTFAAAGGVSMGWSGSRREILPCRGAAGYRALRPGRAAC